MSLAVFVATIVMLSAMGAGFIFLDGVAMWLAVALAIGAWVAALAALAARYSGGRWPFGRADPYDGY